MSDSRAVRKLQRKIRRIHEERELNYLYNDFKIPRSNEKQINISTQPNILKTLNYNLEIASKSYIDFWNDKDRWIILYGGAGSSKSYTTGQKILVRMLSEPNHRFLVCRKVAKTLRVSVFQLFKDLINNLPLLCQKDFKINKSDMTITYLPNNSQLLFFGLDDIEKLKSIQGITGIWIEEASECDEGDINELNRRLRGNTYYYKQIIITFNPISHLHWLKARFFDNPNSKAKIYKTTYLDNRFIDDEYVTELEEMKYYDIQQYNIYALGEWGVLNTNIVYHKYDFRKHISPYKINDFGVLHCGIDFNIGGCVVVIFGIRGDEVHAVDAFVAYDTDEIVINLKDVKYSGKEFILYPDASGSQRSTNSSRTDVQILKDAGFIVDAPKSNPAIRDRINSMNKLMSLNKFFIDTSNPNLERLSHSLQIQAYTEKGEPTKYTDHAKGSIDDWCDAPGYFVNRKFGIFTGAIGMKKIAK